MHDVLSVAITVATILGATFFSNAQTNSLRNELQGLRSEMNVLRTELLKRMDTIERDMRDFYAEQARHDTRIAALERTSTQR